MWNKNVGALIFCLLINGVVDLFIYTFFTAYMLNISGNSIPFISLFYMIVYASIGLGFVSILPLIKRLNKTFVLSVGAIFKAVFILFVVLLGEGIMTHYIWLGALYGFFEAVFWSGGNTLKNKIVKSNKLKSLMSIININNKIVGIVCPIVLGLSIDAWSFEKISIVVLGLTVIQIIASLLIKQTETKDDRVPSFKAFYHAVKDSKYKNLINKTFVVLFVRGLQCFTTTFLTYLIICSYKTNTSLGILTTVGSILSIISVLIFNVIKGADRNIWLYIALATLESISLICAVVFLNKVCIILFQIISVCETIIVNSTAEGIRGSCIRDAGLDKFMPEAVAISEVCLVLGCIVSYVVLLIIGLCNSFLVTLILSVVFCMFIFLYCISLGMLKNYEYKFKKQIDTEGGYEHFSNTVQEIMQK